MPLKQHSSNEWTISYGLCFEHRTDGDETSPPNPVSGPSSPGRIRHVARCRGNAL